MRRLLREYGRMVSIFGALLLGVLAKGYADPPASVVVQGYIESECGQYIAYVGLIDVTRRDYIGRDGREHFDWFGDAQNAIRTRPSNRPDMRFYSVTLHPHKHIGNGPFRLGWTRKVNVVPGASSMEFFAPPVNVVDYPESSSVVNVPDISCSESGGSSGGGMGGGGSLPPRGH